MARLPAFAASPSVLTLWALTIGCGTRTDISTLLGPGATAPSDGQALPAGVGATGGGLTPGRDRPPTSVAGSGGASGGAPAPNGSDGGNPQGSGGTGGESSGGMSSLPGSGGSGEPACPPATFISPDNASTCVAVSRCVTGEVTGQPPTPTSDKVCVPASTFPAQALAKGAESGAMTASSQGLYLLSLTPPLGPARVYRYSLDGTEVMSWEVGSSITGAEIVSVGTEIFIAGTELATPWGQAGFLARYDADGQLVWKLALDPERYSHSLLLATEDSQLFVVSSPFEMTDCQPIDVDGVTLPYCSPDDPNPDVLLRTFDPDSAELSSEVVLEINAYPAKLRDLAVSASGEVYLGLTSPGAVPAHARFDQTGTLLMDRTTSSMGGSVWSVETWLYPSEGSLFVASRVRDNANDIHSFFELSDLGGERMVAQISTFTDPVGLRDFIAPHGKIHAVGRRGPGNAGSFGGYATAFDESGAILSVAPEGAYVEETFTAVVSADDGSVFVGGFATEQPNRAAMLFVAHWPGVTP